MANMDQEMQDKVVEFDIPFSLPYGAQENDTKPGGGAPQNGVANTSPGDDATGPRVLYQTDSTHTDTTLRRLGIIRQYATKGITRREIVFDPVRMAWIDTKTGTPVDPSFVPKPPLRWDVVPKGILYVLGSLKESNFKSDDGDAKVHLVGKRFEHLQSLIAYRQAREVATRHHGTDTPRDNLGEAVEKISGTVDFVKSMWGTNDDDDDDKKASSHTGWKAPHARTVPLGPSRKVDLQTLSPEEQARWKRKEALRLRHNILALPIPTKPVDVVIKEEDTSENGGAQSLGDVERDSRYITKAETLRYLRQYIVRSITGAAESTDSLVITSSGGDLARILGEGGKMINQEGRDGTPPVRIIRVQTLKTSENDKEAIDDNFTDHVFYIDSKEFLQKKKVSPVNMATLQKMCRSLVLELNKGFLGYRSALMNSAFNALHVAGKELTSDVSAPDRPMVPVVVTLFGGDLITAKFEMTLAVEREWPIFVFDGSGGYADILAASKRAADSVLSDDIRYKAFISTLDPITAEVISRGKVLVVNKAQVVDTVTQALECSFYGDETLRSAWARYSEWHSDMEFYKSLYMGYMLSILLVGILATGISIFQTFAQLTWPDLVSTNAPESTTKNTYISLNLVVIFLPILMQLIQTISNRSNAGAKWVCLRYASESIAREIYAYRTQAVEYSNEAVAMAKQNRKNKAEAKEVAAMNLAEALEAHQNSSDSTLRVQSEAAIEGENEEAPAETYETRQELLHLRLEKLTIELSESEFANTTLRPYTGPLPPLHIQVYGDDGFSDLTPEEYVRFRLTPKQREYYSMSQSAHDSKIFLERGIHLFNTLGTVLAALATYNSVREYNLQAWVSFTTALVGALTRYQHMMMLEWLQTKFNKTHLSLTNVMSWWSSRGAHGNTPSNRDELVRRSESIMADEVTEFRKQMKTSLTASANAANAMQQMKEDALKAAGGEVSKEEKQILAKIKEFNIDSINFSSLRAVLDNPASAQAKKVLRALQDLNKDMGDAIAVAKAHTHRLKKDIKTAMQVINDIADVLPLIVDVNGVLNTHQKEISKHFPILFTDVIQDPLKRALFLKSIAEETVPTAPVNLSRKALLKHARAVEPRLETHLRRTPHRILMEFIRCIIVEELCDVFCQALDGMGVSVYDLIQNRGDMHVLLSEMMSLASLPYRYMENRELILALVKNDSLRYTLSTLTEGKLRNILKRADQLFIQKSVNVRFLRALEDRISDVDVVNLILDNEESRVDVVVSITNQLHDFPVIHYARNELLEFFPTAIRTKLEGVDDLLLPSYADRLREGLPASHLFEQWMQRQKFTETTGNSTLLKLHNPESRERILMATKGLTQMDVIRLGKQALLKRLNNCSFIDDALFADLQMCTEQQLRGFFSGVLALHSNSYAGRVFDLLADEITSFDISKMLDMEEQVLLLSRITLFKGLDLNLLTKQDILSTIGFRRICRSLGKLHLEQLRDLIRCIGILTKNTLNVTIFFNAISLTKTELGAQKHFNLSLIQNWRVQTIDRVVRAVAKINDDFFNSAEAQDPKLLIDNLDDSEAQYYFKKAQFPDTFVVKLFSAIRNAHGDHLTSKMFEGVARCITDPQLYKKFNDMFSVPNHREYMLYCMTNLLRADPTLLHLDHLYNTKETTSSLKAKMLECSNDHHKTELKQFLEELSEEFTDDEFRYVVGVTLTECSISCGYNMTLAVADKISKFSLRGVIRGVHCRVLLAPMIQALFDVEGPLKDVTFDRETTTNIEFSKIFHDPNLQEYDVPLNDLAALPKEDLALFFKEYCHVLNTTRVGKFFRQVHSVFKSKHCTKKLPPGQSKWNIFTALLVLKTNIKSGNALVKLNSDFNGFNYQFFGAQLEANRRRIFAQWISSDAITNILVGLSGEDLAFFFSHLKPPAVLVNGADGSGHGTTTHHHLDISDLVDENHRNLAQQVLDSENTDDVSVGEGRKHIVLKLDEDDGDKPKIPGSVET